jgi:hypothetical protein
MVKQLQRRMVKSRLSGLVKSSEQMEILMEMPWRRRGGRLARTLASIPGKPDNYADLHVFKPLEAILWQPIVSIGRSTASTARTASARQYGL